jgi:hypothetical protein
MHRILLSSSSSSGNRGSFSFLLHLHAQDPSLFCFISRQQRIFHSSSSSPSNKGSISLLTDVLATGILPYLLNHFKTFQGILLLHLQATEDASLLFFISRQQRILLSSSSSPVKRGSISLLTDVLATGILLYLLNHFKTFQGILYFS